MTDRLEEIQQICDDHEIEYLASGDDRKTLILKIKKERGFKELYIKEGFSADEFVSNDFYKYRFVQGYEAIWSEEDEVVECLIDCPQSFGFWERILMRHICPERIPEAAGARQREFSIPLPFEGRGNIEIATSSEVFSCFYSYQSASRIRRRRFNPTTIKVSGINVKTHADALKVIKGLMSTVCFQLDSITGLPLQLLAEQQEPAKRHNCFSDGPVSIPKFEYVYDVEALSLYWNAKALNGMPLGQYLAFYQTIEFYYTVYSYRDAQLRIKNLLKDPSFDVGKEKDLSKILNIVKFNNSSNSFGNELEQLKATLKHCIDAREIEGFILNEEMDKDTFNNKQVKKLAKSTINLQYEDSDVLFSDIAKRIYEIRCRIVHTKGVQDNVETLHPLSNEVRFISHDLKLIEFVSKKILIANSQPIVA